jgi:hypothetical protein
MRFSYIPGLKSEPLRQAQEQALGHPSFSDGQTWARPPFARNKRRIGHPPQGEVEGGPPAIVSISPVPKSEGPFGKLRAGSGAPSAWTGDLAGTGAARLVKREQPAVCDEEHAIRNLKLAI